MIAIPEEVFAGNLAVVGKTGSGKSYTAKGAVERMLTAGKRICILDPTGIWWGLRSSADGESPGLPVVVFGGQHADAPIGEGSGEAVAHLLADRNLPAILDLSEFTMGGRTRFATAFFDTLYRSNRTALTLVADEADLFAPQRAMPDQTVMLSRFEQIVRRGRVRGFRTWLITQRPAELHKSVLSQADVLIAMKLPAPQDRDAIGNWIEGQADRDQGKKVLADLPKLQTGEGWVWAPALDLLQRMRFPKITTFDSGRTPEEGEIAPQVHLADVDVGEIAAALEAERAEAEANDPKALRRLIAELQEQVKSAGGVGAPALGQEALEVAVADAEHRGRLEGRKDMLDARRDVEESIEAARSHLVEALARLQSEPVAVPEPLQRQPIPAQPARQSRAIQAPSVSSAGLSGPEQRILDAIAWMASIGEEEPEQAAVAFLAGYSGPENGAYKNPRGSLNQRGMVRYVAGGGIALTAAGMRAANKPTQPGTLAELHDRIIAKLPGPEQRLLQPLLGAYPKPLTNARLAQASGYSDANNGAYKNPRGRLRSLGLIDYPQAGMVVAKPLLFPQGLR